MISPVTRRIVLGCLICITGVLIGLIGEVVGNDLGSRLMSLGVTTNVLYICLLICAVLSVFCIILYESTGSKLKSERGKIRQFVTKIFGTVFKNPAIAFVHGFFTSSKTFSDLFFKIWIAISILTVIVGLPYAIYRKISVQYYDYTAVNCIKRQSYDCAASAYENIVANYSELPDSQLEEYYEQLGDIYNYHLKDYSKARIYYNFHLKTARRSLYREICDQESGSFMGGNPSKRTCREVIDNEQKLKTDSTRSKIAGL